MGRSSGSSNTTQITVSDGVQKLQTGPDKQSKGRKVTKEEQAVLDYMNRREPIFAPIFISNMSTLSNEIDRLEMCSNEPESSIGTSKSH